MSTQAQTDQAQAQTTTESSGNLDRLLDDVTKVFKPTKAGNKVVTEGLAALIESIQTGYGTVSKDSPEVLDLIEEMIGDIDRRLSDQMNLIIHHEKFQKLEGTWRGLRHMVDRTETVSSLKIKVLNVSKAELFSDLKNRSVTGWDQSKLFKKVYEQHYDQAGGEPIGVLIGDYEFGPSSDDVTLLRGISKVAAASHAPFIASASPELLDMESWTELQNPVDLRSKAEMKENAAWNSLRNEEEARYLGLTMPRFLARLPYGSKTHRLDGFNFEEDTDGSDHGKYCWANAAYAFGGNINRAFYETGWTANIRGLESGGKVENLPFHLFPTDDGDTDAKCPTEIAVGGRRLKELDDIGLIPLGHYANTDYACFFAAQSLKRPKEYFEASATADEKLGCRLPYMFSTCRFAHYLNVMMRDKIGNGMEVGQVQNFLNNWIQNFVIDSTDEELKAKHPLRAAEVEVSEAPGDPGFYRAVFKLRPHFQLEGLNASMRLEANVRVQPSK